MRTKDSYIGIDRFRLVAALMVVAIHTGPLLSFGETADLLFTRVLCRLGVPFFFAATGFFLLGRYAEDRHAPVAPLRRFVVKTALVYLGAIALYLPVNLYAGHFDSEQPVGHLLKLVLVDGTMYHLWYLPAVIVGVVLAWALLKMTSFRVTMGVAVALYAVGLLGDSYYAFTAASPPLKALYDGIFAVSSYTRNGLFYAPLFLMVGVGAARRPAPARRGPALASFALCLGLMLAEGLLVHSFGAPRHDSMYLMLPFCLWFLFRWLLNFNGPSSEIVRNVALLVYILHPMVIILVRGGAKTVKLTALLVDNSLVHYLVVSVASFAAAALLVWLGGRLNPKSPRRWAGKSDGQPPMTTRGWAANWAKSRAWVEVDLAALRHNVALLRRLLPAGCKLMPAVKGDAYGCGAVPVARELGRMGVDALCVASLAEGAELRAHGVRGEILVLGYTPPECAGELRRHRLAQTAVDAAHAEALGATGVSLDIHLKVDTGMHRLGEPADNIDAIAGMFAHKNLRVCGVYTQLAASDSRLPEDAAFTNRQISRFWAMAAALEARGIAVPAPHIQCSYGIINYPTAGCAFARPGLAMYGLIDEAHCVPARPDFRPVFGVKARVALVKAVPAGQRVGYGTEHIAKIDMTVAVITIGYGDGLPRALSRGAGGVLVGGCYAPVTGVICMDQTIVDVTAIPGVEAGDEAVLVGRQDAAEITASQLAEWAGTIPNELASRLGRRLGRVYAGA
ncbi:serine racemase VanT catalytic subunit [Ruminococcaceae bacterium OttesenSCG-928-D13]|nr:serine racemase VanT catalytic subunit [Ruminococcaceae bacterium OttesenSCG-928-D13]